MHEILSKMSSLRDNMWENFSVVERNIETFNRSTDQSDRNKQSRTRDKDTETVRSLQQNDTCAYCYKNISSVGLHYAIGAGNHVRSWTAK